MDEQVVSEWISLLGIAERVGFGLLRRDGAGVAPANGVMATFAVDLDPHLFAVADERALRLRDRHGRWRRFRVWPVESAWLVQELPGRGKRADPLPPKGSHPLIRLDGRGRITEANTPAGELLDYFAARERFEETLAEARRKGEGSFDLALDGRVFTFTVHAEGEGAVLLGRDVSERRHEAAALRRNEARLRSLLEAAPDAIVTVAHDGTIDYLNPQGEQIFGHPPGSLQGQPIEALVPDWFRAPAVLAVVGEGEAPCTDVERDEPLTGVRADGSRFPVELSASPLDRDGRLYVTAIIRDVTEREAAAREIRELNDHLQQHVERLTTLNAELEAFSYSVSHDLRGPLRSIDGFSTILLDEYGPQLDEQGRDFLARVHAATGRMGDLIDGLLRLSRITRAELQYERVNLSEIASFIAEGLQRNEPERQVSFRIQEQVTAEGDRALLTVVLENLLGNAWKFTARTAEATIAFGVEVNDGRRVYYVRDNGAGFDMAFKGKLFAPFERLHGPKEYPGTGIGLATVHRVVRRHNGTVWGESTVGKGATFYFTLGERPGPLGAAGDPGNVTR